MKIGAAIQAGFDRQRLRDLTRLPLVWAPVVIRAPHACTVVTCDRSTYWRGVAVAAQDDADRYARQLTQLGRRPARLIDGHEATYSRSLT